MKRVFVTFCNSGYDKEVLPRISDEVRAFDMFDEIHALDESSFDQEFASFWQGRLEGVRGYGYWVWKPYVILRALSNMNEGDELLYCDAGCRMNVVGKKRLQAYLDLLDRSEKGILAYRPPFDHQYRSDKGKIQFIRNYYVENQWIKGDIIDYFRVRESKDILDSTQIFCGTFFVRKCAASVSLIEQWQDIFYKHYDFVTDSPSLSPNMPEFIENRHDQAIFSMLCKLNNIPIMSSSEVEGECAIMNNHPILALRSLAGRGNEKPLKMMRKNLVRKYPFTALKYIFEGAPKLIR